MSTEFTYLTVTNVEYVNAVTSYTSLSIKQSTCVCVCIVITVLIRLLLGKKKKSLTRPDRSVLEL